MIEMVMENATDVRKEWSSVVDSVVHDKPKFIKRTRDRMWLSNLETMQEILDGYTFTAERFDEEDGSVTLSLNEIDLVENAPTEAAARRLLAYSIMDYASEYYENYQMYSKAPNRKGHVPYIFKALITDDAEKIGEGIVCRDGKN
ncbi:hypothetical protein B5F07_18815 [Lachnoclostridium sp. An169]|nr:hypothetical protein B5F07_18815 [Lachnoclostridium sp. An169]